MAKLEQNEYDNVIDHQSGSENIKPGSQSGFAAGVRTILISLVAVVALLVFGYNYTHQVANVSRSNTQATAPEYSQPLSETGSQLGQVKDFIKSPKG